MTTFVLLHGAWHDPSCWEPLADELRARGHAVVAPKLPLHDPHAGWEERIAAAVTAVVGRVGAGPVVVGHSMGAGYAPHVAAALRDAAAAPPPASGPPEPPAAPGKRTRLLPLGGSNFDVSGSATPDGAAGAAGPGAPAGPHAPAGPAAPAGPHTPAGSTAPAGPDRAGGSPAVVLLCPGFGPLRDGFPWPATRADGTSVWEPAAAVASLYRGVPPATARELAARLRPMAPPPDRPPPRPDPPAPTTVVIATDDPLFDPAAERAKAHRRPGVDVREIPGGHFPMVEDPAALAALLHRLALPTAPPPTPRP